MYSRFWQRYSQSPLLRDIVDKAAFFTKAAATMYLIREHLIEFTVVSAGGAGQEGFRGWRLLALAPAELSDGTLRALQLVLARAATGLLPG